MASGAEILQFSSSHISGPCLTHIYGSLQARANCIKEPWQVASHNLCFVSTPSDLKHAIQNGASIIVGHHKLFQPSPDFSEFPSASCFFAAQSIPHAMTQILPLFDTKADRFPSDKSATAYIHQSAQVGQHCRISPFAVINENVVIEDHCLIGAHVVVEAGAHIGASTILHPHVVIGAHCKVGKNCEIHSHTTIGSDGFGYFQSPDKVRHKIPQLGIVVLEDRVEIGANCAIDRATISETRIGEGTKFDNLCHVAHNCRIGKNNVFAAGFFIAGSSQVGDNCMVAGNVAIADHVRLQDDIILGGRSAVTKNLSTPGVYSGYPLEPMKDALRTLANTTHLTTMRKQIATIMKHLGLESTESK